MSDNTPDEIEELLKSAMYRMRTRALRDAYIDFGHIRQAEHELRTGIRKLITEAHTKALQDLVVITRNNREEFKSDDDYQFSIGLVLGEVAYDSLQSQSKESDVS